MRLRTLAAVLVSFVLSLHGQAQSPELSKAVKEFVRVGTPKVVLTHVRVIDGTGAAAIDDQNVVIVAEKSRRSQKAPTPLRAMALRFSTSMDTP